MKHIADISYGSDAAQRLDVYLPDRDSFNVFVYFHGGGLEAGDKIEQRPVFDHLVDRGIAVVSVNYRMYPDAKYPEFVEDAAAAVAWAFGNMEKYGDVQGVYVGGSSAGGYLSMMLCFDRRWLGKYGISPMQIAGFVHDAGQPTCHFRVLKERGIDSRRVIVDDSAPVFHIGVDEEYPPMYFIVSDNDMQNRYEQTMMVMSALRHFEYDMSKVELRVMHGGHCAYAYQTDDEGTIILGRLIAEYIKK